MKKDLRGLGAKFLDAVETAARNAADSPLRYPVWRRNARRILLHKFPYALFYTVHQNHIAIFACFHGCRNPKILVSRMLPG